MTIERRVKQLEERCSLKSGCNRVILKVIEGEEIAAPNEEAARRYLETIGLCEKCEGKCILVWWDDEQRFTCTGQD